jgi:gliding motility-associated-like protein
MKLRIIILVIACAFLFYTNPCSAQVVINEYSASNLAIAVDNYNEYEDYIELYNAGGAPQNIIGYYLSDNKNNLLKWKIPSNVTIPAGGRCMVYCSGKDSVFSNSIIHSNFKLKQCYNEQVILCNAAGTVLDSMTLFRTQANHSYGRSTDGAATWKVFTTPTHNAANTGGFPTYVSKPIASLAGGFYVAAISVALTCADANTTIYYTLNGDLPTTTSTVYAGPINVAATTVIRFFAAHNANTNAPSFIETNTYFINVSHKFSVLSFCGNFGSTAAGGTASASLFDNGSTINQCMEYYDETGTYKWETSGEARKHGNDSWAYNQKGFRIYAQDEFGYLADYNEKFFANTPRDTFSVLLIKAGASDNFPGNSNGTHMRDAFCQTFSIKHNLAFDERSYRPCIVYLNGKYWGLYEIRERVDADYTKYYYDQPESKIDFIRFWGGQWAEYGSDTGWTNLRNFIMWNDMTQQANLDHVDYYLDSLGFLDFHIYNNYVVNSDHMNFNTMWWRGRKNPRVGWHYALWDQDNTFGLGQDFSGWGNTGGTVDPCKGTELFADTAFGNIYHTQMLNKLLTNPKFKQRYQNRYVELVGRCLNCDSLLSHLKEFEDMLSPEMPAQIARWTGGWSGNLTMADWTANVQKIRQFILDRCALVGGVNDSCFDIRKVTVNVSPANSGQVNIGSFVVPAYPFKSVLGKDSTYILTAYANPGYQFAYWTHTTTGNIISPDSLKAIINYTFNNIDSITAVFIVKPKDSFNIIVSNQAPWAGTVLVDGITTVSNLPVTFRWEENTIHSIVASPDDTNKHKFVQWIKEPNGNSIAPNNTTPNANFYLVLNPDNVIAKWDTVINIQKYLYLPNAFTPNGDGINDVFGNIAKYNEDMINAEMQIADRWGNIVYNGDVMKKGWDGTLLRGQLANQDIYFYHLEIKLIDNTRLQFAGDVQLMR